MIPVGTFSPCWGITSVLADDPLVVLTWRAKHLFQKSSRMLGHRSLSTTSIYARFAEGPVREAREAGQKKMLEMMRAAAKRQKATSKMLKNSNG